MDDGMRLRRTIDFDTHRLECRQGCQAVFADQQTLDISRSLGDGAEHEGPVRDGLVARNGYLAAPRGGGRNEEVSHGYSVAVWRSAEEMVR